MLEGDATRWRKDTYMDRLNVMFVARLCSEGFATVTFDMSMKVFRTYRI